MEIHLISSSNLFNFWSVGRLYVLISNLGKCFLSHTHLLIYHPSFFQKVNDFAVKPGSLTKLHKSIQDVMNMIFDIESMNHTLNEFEVLIFLGFSRTATF